MDKIKLFLMNLWEWVKKFTTLSLGLRLLISGVIGILTGSTVFGVISEYVTYFHSLSFGVRPPVEGLGIIRPTITFLSFAMSISTGIIFYLAILFFNEFRKYLERKLRDPDSIVPGLGLVAKVFKFDLIESIRKTIGPERLPKIVLTLIIFSFLIFPILYLLIVYLYTSNNNLPFVETIIENDELFAPLLIVPLLLISFSLILKPNFVSWVALFTSFTFVISTITFSINKDNFMAFLRSTNYGGGIPIAIERKCYVEDGCTRNLNANLFLRTKKYLILYDSESDEFFEVPNEEIMSIRYLDKSNWKLPER